MLVSAVTIVSCRICFLKNILVSLSIRLLLLNIHSFYSGDKLVWLWSLQFYFQEMMCLQFCGLLCQPDNIWSFSRCSVDSELSIFICKANGTFSLCTHDLNRCKHSFLPIDCQTKLSLITVSSQCERRVRPLWVSQCTTKQESLGVELKWK